MTIHIPHFSGDSEPSNKEFQSMKLPIRPVVQLLCFSPKNENEDPFKDDTAKDDQEYVDLFNVPYNYIKDFLVNTGTQGFNGTITILNPFPVVSEQTNPNDTKRFKEVEKLVRTMVRLSALSTSEDSVDKFNMNACVRWGWCDAIGDFYLSLFHNFKMINFDAKLNEAGIEYKIDFQDTGIKKVNSTLIDRSFNNAEDIIYSISRTLLDEYGVILDFPDDDFHKPFKIYTTNPEEAGISSEMADQALSIISILPGPLFNPGLSQTQITENFASPIPIKNKFGIEGLYVIQDNFKNRASMIERNGIKDTSIYTSETLRFINLIDKYVMKMGLKNDDPINPKILRVVSDPGILPSEINESVDKALQDEKGNVDNARTTDYGLFKLKIKRPDKTMPKIYLKFLPRNLSDTRDIKRAFAQGELSGVSNQAATILDPTDSTGNTKEKYKYILNSRDCGMYRYFPGAGTLALGSSDGKTNEVYKERNIGEPGGEELVNQSNIINLNVSVNGWYNVFVQGKYYVSMISPLTGTTIREYGTGVPNEGAGSINVIPMTMQGDQLKNPNKEIENQLNNEMWRRSILITTGTIDILGDPTISKFVDEITKRISIMVYTPSGDLLNGWSGFYMLMGYSHSISEGRYITTLDLQTCEQNVATDSEIREIPSDGLLTESGNFPSVFMPKSSDIPSVFNTENVPSNNGMPSVFNGDDVVPKTMPSVFNK